MAIVKTIAHGNIRSEIEEKKGRNKGFLTAHLWHATQADRRVETSLRDLPKLEKACRIAFDLVANPRSNDQETHQKWLWHHLTDEGASPWRKVLLLTELGFVGISMYASVVGLKILPHFPLFNMSTAGLFSALALGLFNVTAENIKEAKTMAAKWKVALKTGPLFAFAAAIPAWGTFTFLHKAQMDQDGTMKAEQAIVSWQEHKTDLESKITILKEDFEAIDQGQLQELQQLYAAQTAAMARPPPHSPPDRTALDALEAQYRGQIEVMAREADSGAGGRFDGKKAALEAMRLEVEAARAAYRDDDAQAKREFLAEFRRSAAEGLKLLEGQIEAERKALEQAKANRDTSRTGERLEGLETQLEEMRNDRMLLDQALEDAKENRGMIAKMAEQTGQPINRILFLMMLALEGSTYAAAFGLHAARGRPQEQEEVKANSSLEIPPGTVSLVTASVEFGNVSIGLRTNSSQATITRSYHQSGASRTQGFEIALSDLPALEQAAGDLYAWSHLEGGV